MVWLKRGAVGRQPLRFAPLFSALCCSNGVFAPVVISVVLLLCLLGTANADDTEMPPLDPLLEQGLSGLALVILDQSEPDTADAAAWSQWLQRKIAVAGQARAWDVVLDEWRQLAGQWPSDELRLWLSTKAAEAHVAGQQGRAGRQVLLPLLWSGSVTEEQLSHWRWLVVRSYLAERRFEDGYDALLRYQHDYAAPADDEMARVKAELLLGLARYQEAVASSATLTTAPGRVVHLVARARLGLAVTLQDALDVASTLDDPALHDATREALVKTLAELAGNAEHGPQRVELFERLALADAGMGDGLWDSYGGYGAQLANQLQLLNGDYEPWLAAAQQLGQTSVVQAKAIYGWLALNASDQFSQQGHSHLAALIDETQPALMRPLYAGADGAMPAVIVDRLLEAAVAAQDMALADSLLARLEEAPDQLPAHALELRRAAVHALGGEHALAATALARVIASGNSLSAAYLSAYLDTALALLTAGESGAAYDALEAVLPKAPELSARQQVLYWMAQARMMEKRYAQAAGVFVMAATTMGLEPKGDWSRQAWREAANALELAGLPAEAVKVYETLLSSSSDKAQQFLLRRDLQRVQQLIRGSQPATH